MDLLFVMTGQEGHQDIISEPLLSFSFALKYNRLQMAITERVRGIATAQKTQKSPETFTVESGALKKKGVLKSACDKLGRIKGPFGHTRDTGQSRSDDSHLQL